MNIENSEISSFQEDNKSKENSYYNSLDFQKFNKLKQFTNFENSKEISEIANNLCTLKGLRVPYIFTESKIW